MWCLFPKLSIRFIIGFQRQTLFIHIIHIRCKDNKFISFVDEKAWKICSLSVYKAVDIHLSRGGYKKGVDNAFIIHTLFHMVINRCFVCIYM